jgi:hypothetical protein
MHILFTAAIVSFSLYLSLQGIISGTYILLFILGINVFLVLYTASLLSVLYITKTTDDQLQNSLIKGNEDISLKIILRLMLLISVYHIYTLGYVFFAGAATITVLISLFSCVLIVSKPGLKDQ